MSLSENTYDCFVKTCPNKNKFHNQDILATVTNCRRRSATLTTYHLTKNADQHRQFYANVFTLVRRLE